MNVTVDCHSLLLEQSLKKFLGRSLVALEDADIVVTDYLKTSDKPLLCIGNDEKADLKKPFSRSQLFIRLEEVLERQKGRQVLEGLTEEEADTLEDRIERLTRRFVKDIIEIVRKEYETRS